MNPQLEEYIKQARAGGMTDEQIRQELLGAGWREEDINNHLASQTSVSLSKLSSGRLIPASSLLKISFKNLRSKYSTVFKIVFVPLLLWLLAYFTPYIFGGKFLVAIFILLASIASIFSIISSISLIYLFGSDEAHTTKEYLKLGAGKFWSYIWVGILNAIIVMGGFILLIVPGIIFSVWFSLGGYALVLENRRGMEALIRSKHLIIGNWWKVVWRGIFLGLFSLLIYAPFWILTYLVPRTGILYQAFAYLFIMPLSLVYFTALFKNLSDIKPEQFVYKKARKFIVIGIIGLLIIPLLAILLLLQFGTARSSAQDAKRIVDINQLRSALELYYDDNLRYPTKENLSSLAPNYLFVIPKDPVTNADYGYAYSPETNPQKFHIWANLKNCSSSALKQDSDFDSASEFLSKGWRGAGIDGRLEIGDLCIYDLTNSPI